MIQVYPYYVGSKYRTNLWFAGEVVEELLKSKVKYPKLEQLLSSIERWAINDFKNYECEDKIRHEWDGIYRLGIKSGLFRLYGFYENNSKKSFIVLKATLKRGQKLSAKDRKMINSLVKIKDKDEWKKSNE